MLNLRNLALASACAWVAGATAFAPAALAEHSGKGTKNYDIYGGGASVPAPYARQTFDCYANPTDLIILDRRLNSKRSLPSTIPAIRRRTALRSTL